MGYFTGLWHRVVRYLVSNVSEEVLPSARVLYNEDYSVFLIIKPTRCTNFSNLFLE